jgi:ATP-dependent Lhr-like helicase
VQERAIPALLAGDRDIILAAATSAGKTEAAFFPILTRLLQSENEGRADGGLVLSISPLKALINDQAQRLQDICRSLDLPVLGWHGDIPASRKQRFLGNPSGVLIITPESLEALFVTRGTAIPALAKRIQYIVIDELHSFLGTERGKQVQSLMARVEQAAGRTIPRIGLSATLGNTTLAAEFLRPDSGESVETIDAGGEAFQLQLIVKAYIDDRTKPPAVDADTKTGEQEEDAASPRFKIASYLYKHLRGTNNLIFPNSRAQVEFYADLLRRQCESDGLPNQFFAHHGSLSRELREDAEATLKSGTNAANAVCTTTLELGIDIGSIKSVAQIGPPPSVASLRQRLGRSGRKPGESAILRCFSIERKLTADSSFSDRLHEGLLQTIAMVNLLLRGWVEPRRPGAMHASTLIQQVLSVIAQRGGATVAELWQKFVVSGTFDRITREDFLLLLRTLGENEILQQESGGLLLPGPAGEKLINHYDFYSAFVSVEEFRLIAEGNTLGSLPLARPLNAGQRIIFAGRRWRVLDVDSKRKLITVTADPGGVSPSFDGSGSMIHDCVRHEMLSVLRQSNIPSFLDSSAADLLAEARDFFRSAALEGRHCFPDGNSIVLLTWRGDWINDTLALLLTALGLATSNEGIGLRVHSADGAHLEAVLRQIAASQDITPEDLHLTPGQTCVEKWDWALPDGLRLHSFASNALDLDGAQATVVRLIEDEEACSTTHPAIPN